MTNLLINLRWELELPEGVEIIFENFQKLTKGMLVSWIAGEPEKWGGSV